MSLEGVLDAARFIADALGRPLATKVGQAGGWDPATGAAHAADGQPHASTTGDVLLSSAPQWTVSCSF